MRSLLYETRCHACSHDGSPSSTSQRYAGIWLSYVTDFLSLESVGAVGAGIYVRFPAAAGYFKGSFPG